MKNCCICRFCVVLFPVFFAMAEPSPRPYLRSNLARTVYDRMMTDERLRTMDLSKMYEVDEQLLNDSVLERFIQMSVDEDTRTFLDNCFEQSEWLVTQVWHTVAKSFLGLFMTQTSVNGLLGRGRMFVWSESQAKQLLGANHPQEGTADVQWENEARYENGVSSESRDQGCEQNIDIPHLDEHRVDLGLEEDQEKCLEHSLWVGERLLDLGAGDGHVTQVLAGGARHVDVTEASPVMRKRLRDMGYRVLDTWEWMNESKGIQYDVITALNLLDRCDTPRTLINHIHKKLCNNGSLVVALVLPFCPYVEVGSPNNLPSENLGVTGSTKEEQINSLATEVFPSLGFQLSKWTRLPYLCEGDLDQAFYWLSDVVMVFRKVNDNMLENTSCKKCKKEATKLNKNEL